MKHFKWMLTVLLLVTTICFMACTSTKADGSGGDTVEIAAEPAATSNVVEIMFNDGTSVAYTSDLSLTEEQKSKAIAVIYKTDGDKAYGVGLVQNTNGLAWCLNSAKGFGTKITDILCTVSRSGDDRNGENLSFTGDTDGSDNFAKIGEALGADNDTDDLSKYPAFGFAINYKDNADSHVAGTAYETGWYLPTISEMYDIWKEKETVNAAIALCGGTQFSNRWYWTSSQHDENDGACWFDFSNSGDGRNVKMEPTNAVCAIRKF